VTLRRILKHAFWKSSSELETGRGRAPSRLGTRDCFPSQSTEEPCAAGKVVIAIMVIVRCGVEQ
jgi:hypothetical protein